MLITDAFVPWALKGQDAKSMPMIVSVTDVKTMPPVSIKSDPMNATVPVDFLANSAKAKSPFVPLPNSAPVKMAANVLITLLITLASVCPDLLASIVLITSMIVLTICVKMEALVSMVSTNTLVDAHPNTAANSAKLNPWWRKCTSKLRLVLNTIVSMESVSNRLEVTTTFANVPQDTQVWFKIDYLYHTV